MSTPANGGSVTVAPVTSFAQSRRYDVPVARFSLTTTALRVADANVPRWSEPPSPDASTASHDRPSAAAGVTE